MSSPEKTLSNIYDATIRNILNRLEEDGKRIVKLEKEIEGLKDSMRKFGGFVINQIEQVKSDNGGQ